MKSFLAACDGQGEAKASDPLAGAFFAPVLFRNEDPLASKVPTRLRPLALFPR